jgi:hypothetical protein
MERKHAPFVCDAVVGCVEVVDKLYLRRSKLAKSIALLSRGSSSSATYANLFVGSQPVDVVMSK